MYKILLTLPKMFEYDDDLEKLAKGCEFVYIKDDDVRHEDLQGVDIVIGNPPTSELHDLPKLKWVQLHTAGSDNYAKLPIFSGEGAPILCNSTGAYGRTIAEQMVGYLIALQRDFFYYRDFMPQHDWNYLQAPDIIGDKKCLIMGLGDIGLHFARLLDVFGTEVYAVKRTRTAVPEYIKGVYTMDELDEVLPEMDYVALCLPNSPQTTHVINEHTLSLMKKSAFVINVGRGNSIDHNALAAALKSGTIAGAALDVTEPEPLPADHPLWDCKNCTITPHIAGHYWQHSPYTGIMSIAKKNLEHFLKGEALENTVDLKTGYMKR